MTSIPQTSSIHQTTLPLGEADPVKESALKLISCLQDSLEEIDIPYFLQNIRNEDGLCARLSNEICQWAEHQPNKDNAYQSLLSALEKYESQKPLKSTFALRNSILLASQKSDVFLHSWNVFTKQTGPQKNKWDYLDTMKSWMPEEQRVMGKWVETNMTRCRRLSSERPAPEVILLKGGFGAGKTSLITEKLGQDHASCVLAPDKAKEVVRRYFPHMPHSVAHEQGSAISYKFFNEVINKLPGTVVYDSALSDPRDLAKYIDKAEASHKKVIVYDVARVDTLRALAVLKRPIHGEDPRILPEAIISGAVWSKLTRDKCMKLVLDHKPRSTDTAPEYHFFVTDASGTDRQEILTLTHNTISIPENAKDICQGRLGLEKLKIDEHNGIVPTTSKEEIEQGFRAELNEPVSVYVNQLSNGDQPQYAQAFAQRVLPFQPLKKDEPLTLQTLYSSLAPWFKKYVSEKTFTEAFSKVSEEAKSTFLKLCSNKLKEGRPITYLDLPLYSALAIHGSLKEDPWELSDLLHDTFQSAPGEENRKISSIVTDYLT